MLRDTARGERVNSITSIAVFFKPSPRCYTPQLSPIFCVAKHPVRLWDTAGEERNIFRHLYSTVVLTPPSLRATSPIFCVAKRRGGG